MLGVFLCVVPTVPGECGDLMGGAGVRSGGLRYSSAGLPLREVWE